MGIFSSPEEVAEELIEWGRSGSLYPSLIPDEASMARLKALQTGVLSVNDGAIRLDRLHCTLFHVRPYELFQDLRAHLTALREERLYMGLSSIVVSLGLFNPVTEASVEGLDRFGPEQDVVGLRISESNHWAARKMLKTALASVGVADGLIEELRDREEYKWSLGDSIQHISLVGGVSKDGRLPEVDFSRVGFDGFIEGSTRPPGDNPLKWHLHL